MIPRFLRRYLVWIYMFLIMFTVGYAFIGWIVAIYSLIVAGIGFFLIGFILWVCFLMIAAKIAGEL